MGVGCALRTRRLRGGRGLGGHDTTVIFDRRVSLKHTRARGAGRASAHGYRRAEAKGREHVPNCQPSLTDEPRQRLVDHV